MYRELIPFKEAASVEAMTSIIEMVRGEETGGGK